MFIISKMIDRRIAAYQQSLVNIHYAEVENMYRQMRGWRHDYHHHIQTMKSYAAAGDVKAVASYLEALDNDLRAVETVVKTGNKMADAILNSKISLARSQHIAVTPDAQVAVELTASPLDLCVLLGNLLDNAIEACAAVPENERYIRLFMEMKNTRVLYISITNSAAQGKKQKVNGRFISGKGVGHGFGLARADHIVERYGGYISRNSEDGAFTTEVLLPQ